MTWSEGRVDLKAMKELLASMPAAQLIAVHKDSQSGEE